MQHDYHADFDYEVINDVVAVFDLDLGNRSATNDVNYVLETLKNTIPNLHRILIKSLCDKGIFHRIFSIGEDIFLEQVLEKLKADNFFCK